MSTILGRWVLDWSTFAIRVRRGDVLPDRINPLLGEMARQLQITIELMNNQQERVGAVGGR